mgnify:CR=1 FL=1
MIIPQNFGPWTLAGILIFVGLFFLLREFWCWYWKINERLNLLKKIEENTRQKN